MLYWELAKHTFPRRGETTRFSSVEYVLKEGEEALNEHTALLREVCGVTATYLSRPLTSSTIWRSL